MVAAYSDDYLSPLLLAILLLPALTDPSGPRRHIIITNSQPYMDISPSHIPVSVPAKTSYLAFCDDKANFATSRQYPAS
ncbi:hypothetical protein C1H76_1193 [Elsinoe australis]|uniref:Uncharacterized protein n=1 Tax=Elsinoe australis TaxID=40998 RepID=A0A4U7B9P9_9PEZI|nr:hypothetical protein C1H76_1193 [Elsinoe australis]